VRTQERDGPIGARLAGDIDHLDAGLFQRVLRLQLEAGIIVRDGVVVDPVVDNSFFLFSHSFLNFCKDIRLKFFNLFIQLIREY